MRCRQCDGPIPSDSRIDAVVCSRACNKKYANWKTSEFRRLARLMADLYERGDLSGLGDAVAELRKMDTRR